MVTIGPQNLVQPYIPLGSIFGTASPSSSLAHIDPYLTNLYGNGSHPNSQVTAGIFRYSSGNFGLNNRDPNEDGWLAQATNFFKRICQAIMQTFDDSANASSTPQMLEFAGTGMVMPVFAGNMYEPVSSEEAKHTNMAMMSGDAPPDSVIPDLYISKTQLQRRLRENKYKRGDIELIEDVFERLQGIPSSLQQRSIKIAFKLIEWNAHANAVAAALCLHNSQSVSNHGIFKNVKRILSSKADLEKLTCDWSDERQIDYFRSLIFLTVDNILPFLILAAEDLVDLEETKNPSSEAPPEIMEKAHRSFIATSWILKLLNYGDDAGKIADLALLHIDPCSYQTVKRHLRAINGMDRAASLKKLRRIAQDIEEVLEMNDLRHKIKYRVKRIASAKRRLEEKGNYDDTNGIRVILYSNRAEDCYKALFAIREYFEEEGWKELPPRQRDYIANKKKNGYQSLHDGFCDESDYTVEIQIRTREMDRAAEIGSASHSSYKTGETLPVKASKEKLAPAIAFDAKRQQMIDAGVHFVYDEKSGNIVKLVTGSPKTPPTVLDFAFARSINLGLRASTGYIDGKHAKLDDPLCSGQHVSFKAEGPVQVNGRRKSVATSLAKAALEVTARNMHAITSGQFSLKSLVSRGEQEFRAVRYNVNEELRKAYGSRFKTGKPTLAFSLDRLCSRMGIPDKNLFFATLAALPEGMEKEKFIAETKSRIKSHGIFHARKGKNVEIISTGEGSLLKQLLEHISATGLELESMEVTHIRGSSFYMARASTVRQCEPCVKSFLDSLDDPSNYASYSKTRSASTLDVKIRARMNYSKPKIAMAIVNTILDSGAEIKACSIPQANKGQIVEYTFKIQLPHGWSKKRGAAELANMLGAINGTGQVVIV